MNYFEQKKRMTIEQRLEVLTNLASENKKPDWFWQEMRDILEDMREEN